MLSRTLMMTALMGASASLIAVDSGDIEIHGFASMGYMKSSDNNYLGQSKQGSFEFNEFGLNFRTEIDDKTSFGLQFFSRDLGALGNNEINLDWGFLDHSINDMIGIRLGRVKLPSAMYNEVRDVDAVRATVLMPQGIYNLNFRDVSVAVDGIATYGTLSTESVGDIEYNLYLGTLPISNDGSVARAFTSLGITGFDNNQEHAFGGNVTWNTPLEGLRVAYAYQHIHDWALNGNVSGIGAITYLGEDLVIQTLSAEYTYEDWVFAAEYQIFDGTLDSSSMFLPDVELNSGTWYLQAQYRVNEKLEVATYYSEYLDDRDDTDGSGASMGNPDYSTWQKDLTFAARYDLNDAWNIKAEIHVINGTALTSAADGRPNDEEDWTLFTIKSTVSF